jgi:hypothetical protein
LWLLLLLAISGLVQIANQTLITTEILADEFSRYFDDEMAFEMAEKNLTVSRQLIKLGITWVVLLFKVSLFTGVIWVGLAFLKAALTISELFEIVIKNYLIFFLLDITKLLWFSFFETEYSLSRLNEFNPFSFRFFFTELFTSANNVLIKIIGRIDLLDLLFCFAVSQQLIQRNTGSSSTRVYQAVFISYFTMIIGLAVVLTTITI